MDEFSDPVASGKAMRDYDEPVNRYCRAGMCVASDEKHEPDCKRHEPATAVQAVDNLMLGADAKASLLHIGKFIGFGRAQQILGELWDTEHNCAPRGSMGVTIKDTELTACLRGAVTVMELLDKQVNNLPGLPALIECSKAALKEYDK